MAQVAVAVATVSLKSELLLLMSRCEILLYEQHVPTCLIENVHLSLSLK